MQAALSRHDDLLRSAVTTNSGYVFKTVGDGCCAAFSRPQDALAAAVDAQRAIAAEDWRPVGGLRVRMAIHAGLADERDGDYYGPVLNRIARILDMAHGGQVLVSGTVAELIEDRLPARATLRDLGSHRLRDLSKPEAIYQLTVPDLASDFPSIRSLETFSNNLPVQLTSFVGRETEIAEIARLLESAHLVTLAGAGGVGKTRSALQVGADLVERYPDGVWLAELAPVVDSALVPSAIAQVFNIEDAGSSRPLIDSIVLALKHKQTLIILDNCEHLVSAVAEVAERILSRCPKVKMIATSREPLGIAGEQVYRMPSLAVPPITEHLTAEKALEYGAVALFAARAQSAQKNFALSDGNAAIVADIVRRLDGIALAIELAAPRIKVLSAAQLAHRLDERFKLLTGGSRTALPRQQTLRAMIGWSYDLLTDGERSLLRQLAIFRGGCTLEAAQEICADERIADWDVFELLSCLVDKSLVVAHLEDENERYSLLETTRQYALERLEETGGVNAVAARHCMYFSDLAERLLGEIWETTTDCWLESARADLENYRAAIDWSLARGNDIEAGAAIVAALRLLWYDSFRREGSVLVARALQALNDDAPAQLRGRLLLTDAYIDERALQAAEQAVTLLAQCNDGANHAFALRALAACLARRGKLHEALERCEEALTLARRLGIARLAATITGDMGYWSAEAGNVRRGRALLEETVALHRSSNDVLRMAIALVNLAEVRFGAGDGQGAFDSAREAQSIVRRIHNDYRLMILANNLAAYSLSLHDHDTAWLSAREALELALAREQTIYAAIAIGHLAEIAAFTGDCERAARLVGYVDAVYAAEDCVRESTEKRGYDRAMSLLRQALPRERLTTLMNEGACFDASAALAESQTISRPRDLQSQTA